jgi:hypothetical protein
MVEVIDLTNSPPPKRARGVESSKERAGAGNDDEANVCIDLDGEAGASRATVGENKVEKARIGRVLAILPTVSRDSIVIALSSCKTMTDDAAVESALSALLASSSSASTDEELAARLAAAEQRAVLSSDRELACRLAAADQRGVASSDGDLFQHKSEDAGKAAPRQPGGIESEKTGKTEGVLEALHLRLMEEAAETAHYEAYICTDTVLYSSVRGDKGWSCGYRNAQMILSHLLSREDREQRLPYRERLNGVVPSLHGLQTLIEGAWGMGFDVEGASQLGHAVVSTKKWIGTTEVAVLLRSQGIRAQIVDFSSLVAPHGRQLLRWVYSYFSSSRSQESKAGPSTGGRVNFSRSAPLYLQHQGHSRLIVGVCRSHGVDELLILDPGQSSYELKASLAGQGRDWKRKVKFALDSFKARQHQVALFFCACSRWRSTVR